MYVTGPREPSPTSDGTTGEPPPETALLVHSFGEYAFGPLEETEPCAQWTLHNEQPLYVNTVTLANDGGYHHARWRGRQGPAAELDAPLYVPPTAGADVDLDPVKPCIDTSADAQPTGPWIEAGAPAL